MSSLSKLRRALPRVTLAPGKILSPQKPFPTSLKAQQPIHLALRRALATSARKPGAKKDTPSSTDAGFWTSIPTWKRSGINTFRCLVGCTTGDFSAMWYLQSAYPELSTMATMSLSMATGIMTSILLETTLLHFGRDCLPWKVATKTATGMSMISMLVMEVVENTVDYTLTGGYVDLGSPFFWVAAGSSALAGFLVPLPYNYFQLRAYRKSCH